MKYKLDQTPDGPRWIKQIWDERTESINEEALPVGESITFDPRDFVGNSNVFVFKDQISEPMLHEDGTPYSLQEYIDELVENQIGNKKFEPTAFYNKAGDMLEIYWENCPSYVKWLNSKVEIQKSFDDDRIVGATVWGLKKILLQAYANCDEPTKHISITALNPYYKEESDETS